MKKLSFILTFLLVSTLTVTAKEKVKIPALSAVELTYEEFAEYDLKLSNSSGKGIDVSVHDPITGKKIKGFGMGPFGKVFLSVDEGQVLKLKNTTTKELSITIDFVEKREVIPPSDSDIPSVTFTLHNSSSKSIPLIIPGVMNPNLSPFSNSGVYLKKGQKIYHKKGMKKVLILTVDDSIKEGDKIDIAKLIKEKRG